MNINKNICKIIILTVIILLALTIDVYCTEDTSTTTDTIDQHIVDIYNLLSSVISGNVINVKVADYGLTSGAWNP